MLRSGEEEVRMQSFYFKMIDQKWNQNDCRKKDNSKLRLKH